MNFFGSTRPSKFSDWQQVSDARVLIGDCAIRTGVFTYENGNHDFSFQSNGVWIQSVSPQGHIVFKYSGLDKLRILEPGWNDGNWAKAPDSLCKSIHGFEKMIKEARN